MQVTRGKAEGQSREAKPTGKAIYLEHHLELCRKGEESTEHGAHGHEHELEEKQSTQIVDSRYGVGLPSLQPEQTCSNLQCTLTSQ